MSVDRTRLAAALADPRYAASAAAGKNGTLLHLLAEVHPSQAPIADRLPAEAVITAAGADVTAELLAWLGLTGGVDCGQAGQLAALDAVAPKARRAIEAAATRMQTYAEVGCGGPVTLEDLWAVLPLVPGSLHKQQLDDDVADLPFQAQRAVENRLAWHLVQEQLERAAGNAKVADAYALEATALQAELATLGGPAPAKAVSRGV